MLRKRFDGEFDFPLLEDKDHKVIDRYGIFNPDGTRLALPVDFRHRPEGCRPLEIYRGRLQETAVERADPPASWRRSNSDVKQLGVEPVFRKHRLPARSRADFAS